MLKLQAIVTAPWFRRTIFATILVAGALAGLQTSPELVARHGGWLRALDTAVIAIFVVEAALKMGAHGRRPWRYFQDGWNCFDFIIVVLCLLPSHSDFAAVVRLARSLRLLRLVSALPRLQLLVGALFKSVRAMGYVCLLLALLYYIYAVSGVQLFASHAPELFGSLSAAHFTLFRLMTLDNWSDLFALLQPHAPFAAPLYFVSFILLGTMIMLNLFIGIVMNSMTEMHAELEAREARRSGEMRPADLSTLAAELQRIAVQLEASARPAPTPFVRSPHESTSSL